MDKAVVDVDASLPSDWMNTVQQYITEAMGPKELMCFYRHTRVAPYRFGHRKAVCDVQSMNDAMIHFAKQTGTNLVIVRRLGVGSTVGPVRHYQQGLGWHFPGRSLDIIGGSDTFTVCVGGSVQYSLSSASVFHSIPVEPGMVVRLKGAGNMQMDHTVGAWESDVHVCTFAVCRMAGAKADTWTTPARRLH